MFMLNAFSLNMFTVFPSEVRFMELTVEQVKEEIAYERRFKREIVSGVGHADTAAVFSDILGEEIPMSRINVKLGLGDRAIVGQYTGPRLPEGATTLPEGATIKWFLVVVKKDFE